VAFSPDGETLASAGSEHSIFVWVRETGEMKRQFTGHAGDVRSMAYLPHGNQLVSGSVDKTIRFWDPASGDEQKKIEVHRAAIQGVACARDGQTLASSSDDRTIKLLGADTGEEQHTLTGHTDGVAQAAFSPDGRRLASASWDKTIRILDVATGKLLLTIDKQEDAVRSVAFSPDGRRLASGGDDNTIRLWDPEKGVQLATLRGHKGAVTSVAFSADGRILASASADRTVMMWELEEAGSPQADSRLSMTDAQPVVPAQTEKQARAKQEQDEPPPTRTAVPPKPARTLMDDDRWTARKSIFDGKTTAGWGGFLGEPLPSECRVADDCMELSGNRYYIYLTAEEFDNFEFAFEWRVSEGGNSGVYYRVRDDIVRSGYAGLQMQLVDNNDPDAKRRPDHRAGALWQLYPPVQDAVRPVGEWNTARIVVEGSHVEHWLNSVKVVEYELGGMDFQSQLAKSDLRDRGTFWSGSSGRIALEGWSGTTWYRNLTIRRLKPTGPAPPPAIAPFDAKKAKEHQGAWAKHLGVKVEMTNSIGMRFELIPPGEFDMGSTEAEVAKLLEEAKAKGLPGWLIERLPAEAPKHRVRVTKAFYLGMCEVTQGDYERLVGTNPSKFKDDPTHPVEMVNWDEASAFCRKLGDLPQEQAARAEYRLPTEAEWEYACRAGTTTTWYSGGDEGALKEHAWFNANAGGKTHPVGQKSPNAWGLYDMHGNVWEWCQDWWGDRYYATSPMDDPPGASGGSTRVTRAGCWWSDASHGRASYRHSVPPGDRFENHGFRLARTVSGAESGLASPQKGGVESPQSKDRPTPKPSATDATQLAAKPVSAASKPTAPAPPPAIAPFDAARDSATSKTTPRDAELVQLRKIWDRAPHNGFTDLVRFQDRWFCVFREAQERASLDGALRIITSADGETWESASVVTSANADLRDPKITVTPGGQAMLSSSERMNMPAGERFQSLTWFSDDGRTWGERCEIADRDFWLWRTMWHKGKAYGFGYDCRNDTHSIRLYTSDDGRKFETLLPNAFPQGFPTETSLAFHEDDTCYCLLRLDGQPNTAQLGVAQPPYTVWKWKDSGLPIGGPNVIRLPDGRFVAAVRGLGRTSLHWLDPEHGVLPELLKLPSGGDTGYAGLVWHDGRLWISYHSSHEGKTSIYLAQVRTISTRPIAK